MGVKKDTPPVDKRVARMDDGLGARKRVFIPGYSGVISRMNETIAGTFAQNSRDSHYLVYHGCRPLMDAATLPAPDTFYSRKPNPRIKTNAANRSNFQFGDERDWGFETINETQFRIPTKIPPRHASILPGGLNCGKEELDQAYNVALGKVGVAGVKRLELAIRSKIDQRTTGGPMALRKAFKFFDTDASGDIDPDEFYAAMHAFGLEFTEDQVLALFGYYDADRDGTLSYYEFIEKLLESGFGLDGPKEPPVLVQLAAMVDEGPQVEVKTTLREGEVSEEWCREVFDKFDANKSGEIDIRELQQLTRSLGLSLDRESINNAMFELDQNRNGAISFEEFWTWWQLAATRKGQVPQPKTGGNRGSPNEARGQQSMRRPKSQQSTRTAGSFNTGISRPGSRESGTADLKSALLGMHAADDEDKAPGYLKSKGQASGTWLTQAGRPGSRSTSALSRPSRPVTRNSQRSVAGEDYSPPPLLNRPPRLFGLRAMRASLPPRPSTAPTDPFGQMTANDMGAGYIRLPGTPAVPNGVTTGYVL